LRDLSLRLDFQVTTQKPYYYAPFDNRKMTSKETKVVIKPELVGHHADLNSQVIETVNVSVRDI
jgi:hypothetical protein